jgi:hypothetical protein
MRQFDPQIRDGADHHAPGRAVGVTRNWNPRRFPRRTGDPDGPDLRFAGAARRTYYCTCRRSSRTRRRRQLNESRCARHLLVRPWKARTRV